MTTDGEREKWRKGERENEMREDWKGERQCGREQKIHSAMHKD